MRVNGEWITMNIAKADAVEDTVRSKFDSNTYSHSIVFRAKKGLYDLYDKLTVRIGTKLFRSYIATIVETKNSELSEYTCGELQCVFPFLEKL